MPGDLYRDVGANDGQRDEVPDETRAALTQAPERLRKRIEEQQAMHDAEVRRQALLDAMTHLRLNHCEGAAHVLEALRESETS